MGTACEMSVQSQPASIVQAAGGPYLLQWGAEGWPLARVQTQCAVFAAGHRASGRTCRGWACGGRRMGQAADSSPATEGPAQAAAREQASLAAAEF